MTAEMEKVIAALEGLELKLAPKLEKQDAEIKKMGGTNTQTAERLGDLEKKHDALERELKDMVVEAKKRLDEMELAAGRPGALGIESKADALTMGERFAQAPEYKSWIESHPKGRGNMAHGVKVSTFERKDLSGAAALRGIFATQRVQQIFYDPLRMQRVRDLLTVIPTGADSVEYVIEQLYIPGAAPVEEGEQKPEASLSFDDDVQPIRTIAHWIPVNRQILADINTLAVYINMRLMEGLKIVEDQQILYGDGEGQNLQGILNTPGIQEYLMSMGPSTDTKIDAIRRAITKSQLAFYPVTGCVLHPSDWEDIETTKSTEGLYVWVNVSTGAEPMLWKVPIVTTSAIEQGDALTGAFSMGAALWDREDANIRTTDSHNDFFTKNRQVVLCEERVGLTVFRPKSFVRVIFGTPGTYGS